MVKYSFKALAVVSASALLQGRKKDVDREVVLENQDVLMTGARFSNVEKIEVQEVIHALSMDLLAEMARNLGTT